MDEIILKEIYNQVKNGYKVALATITNWINTRKNGSNYGGISKWEYYRKCWWRNDRT